jgi:hypothetical protein
MADEVTHATARATETGETEELSKAELQRRMEEARESISQTVAEIKDTVVNQYQSVRDTVTETLDWREQYRKRPLAWSLSALGAGFIVGYSIAGVFKGDGYDDDDEDTLSPEDSRVFNLPPPPSENKASYAAPRAYAAQSVAGGAYGSSAYAGGVEKEYDAGQSSSSRGSDYSYGGGVGAETQAADEPQGPGLIERFKETKAYDRLQEEVSTLGDRFIEELSRTAQAVVLPALFGKVKELFGVDLSGKQGRGGNDGGNKASAPATTTGSAQSSGGAQASQASSGAAGGSSTGGSSYATSDNRPYGGGQGGQS